VVEGPPPEPTPPPPPAPVVPPPVTAPPPVDPTPVPPPAPTGPGDFVIAAAGDIACDPVNDGGPCQEGDTSNLMLAMPRLDAVLALGDNAYYCGSLASYRGSFDRTWGRLKSILRPTTGNHEYLTNGGTGAASGCDASNAGARGYYGYFGKAGGAAGQGYYSFDLGNWHLIALNSQCGGAGGCSSGSAQDSWLKADLQANAHKCILAYWHIPLFSSGGRANPNTLPFWERLYAAGADVILTGHDHIYERFAPQSPSGALDRTRGIRQFVVGTGGANHTSLAVRVPNSEVYNVDTFGVLKMTLHPHGYDWQFVPVPRKSFTDSGSGTCHNS
jgi:hypothetical protein